MRSRPFIRTIKKEKGNFFWRKALDTLPFFLYTERNGKHKTDAENVERGEQRRERGKKGQNEPLHRTKGVALTGAIVALLQFIAP